jgi:hypothetical protein
MQPDDRVAFVAHSRRPLYSSADKLRGPDESALLSGPMLSIGFTPPKRAVSPTNWRGMAGRAMSHTTVRVCSRRSAAPDEPPVPIRSGPEVSLGFLMLSGMIEACHQEVG